MRAEQKRGRGKKEKSFGLICASAEKKQTHRTAADWCLQRRRRTACHPSSISTAADKTAPLPPPCLAKSLTLLLVRQTLILEI